MREFIEEIEKNIKTKEDLIFFIQEIDLANELILKNSKKNIFEVLKGKINPVLFSVLENIEKEEELKEKEKREREKIEFLERKKELNKNLKIILKKEQELEKKIKEIEEKESKTRSSKKEIETERWKLEEERIKIEKDKWRLKENYQEIQNNLKNLKKIKVQKKERDFKQFIFFLELVRDHLISLPTVNLQLSFEPSQEIIDKISQWFKKEYDKKFILNFKTNPKIVGGVIIEFGGQILDFSLIKEIRNFLIKNKNREENIKEYGTKYF